MAIAREHELCVLGSGKGFTCKDPCSGWVVGGKEILGKVRRAACLSFSLPR